jgi:segregation and condensation protein B
MDQPQSIIEALFFVSKEPLKLDKLQEILETPKDQIERAIHNLKREYDENNRGMIIVETADGFQMATNPAFAQWVQLVLAVEPARLSKKSLEALSIIAYKQPITRAEIEALRGVISDGAIKTLLDRKLIKIIGRKDVPGRPLLYGTTKEFLNYFGVKNLSELPKIKDFPEE